MSNGGGEGPSPGGWPMLGMNGGYAPGGPGGTGGGGLLTQGSGGPCPLDGGGTGGGDCWGIGGGIGTGPTCVRDWIIL